MTLSRKDSDVFPGDKRWVRESSKIGGANVGEDTYTGVYVLFNAQHQIISRCLIKQDWLKGRLRVEKVIGEGIAGYLLNHIYPEVMGVSRAQFAEVHLIRCDDKKIPDPDGKNVYLQSIYITNYADDLWKFAFREHYKEEVRRGLAKGLTEQDKNIIEEYYKNKIKQYRGELIQLTVSYAKLKPDDISGISMNQSKEDHKYKDYERKIEKYKKKISILNRLPLNTLLDVRINEKTNTVGVISDAARLTSDDRSFRDYIVDELAQARVDPMKRPSGSIFNVLGARDSANYVETRAVISKFIASSPELLEDFAQMAAPRIFLGDFGLHNGNFGVAIIDGKPRIVSLDYGAAFANLIEDVNPFTNRTGLQGFDKLYKNHFKEYDKNVIASEAMGRAFVKLGSIDNLIYYVATMMQDDLGDTYGIDVLKQFCKRVNMDAARYEHQNDNKQLKETIQLFLIERLNKRGQALKELGYTIILEHCFDPNKKEVNERKFAETLNKYPDMLEYILSGKFKQTEVIFHDNYECKNALDAAANNYLLNQRPQAIAQEMSDAIKNPDLSKLHELYRNCVNLEYLCNQKDYPADRLETIKKFQSYILEIKKTIIKHIIKIVEDRYQRENHADPNRQLEHLARLKNICVEIEPFAKRLAPVAPEIQLLYAKLSSLTSDITASMQSAAEISRSLRIFAPGTAKPQQEMQINTEDKPDNSPKR
jgi:hypothetical protein